MSEDDITRIHKRLDDLFTQVTEITGDVKQIKQRCEPCSKMVNAHQDLLRGNGKRTGLITQLATLKEGRVDTLSIKSVLALVAALTATIGTLAAAIGAAMAR